MCTFNDLNVFRIAIIDFEIYYSYIFFISFQSIDQVTGFAIPTDLNPFFSKRHTSKILDPTYFSPVAGVTCQSKCEQSSAFGATNEGIKSKERRERRKSSTMRVGPFVGIRRLPGNFPNGKLRSIQMNKANPPVAPPNGLERPQS